MEKPIQDIALEILNKLSPGDCLECEWQSGHTVFKFGVKKQTLFNPSNKRYF